MPEATIQFFCAEFNTFFEVQFQLTDEWNPVVVPFASLHEPNWKAPTNTPLQRCLSVVEAVDIIVQDDHISDGQCHSGSLWVDNISFR